MMAVIMFVSSCNHNQLFLETALHTADLKLENKLGVSKDSIGNPDYILSIDDYIIIGDNNKDNLLVAYHTVENKFNPILIKGKGANESLIVTNLNQMSNNLFYTYDDFLKKQFIFRVTDSGCCLSRIDDAEDLISFSDWDNIRVSSPKSLIDQKYQLTNLSNSASVEFGNFDNYDVPKVLNSALADGQITINGNLNRFAWFSTYGTSFDIGLYNNEQNPEVICSKSFDLPEYKVSTSQSGKLPIFSLDSKLGFTSVTSSYKYIYATYKGVALSEFVKNRNQDFYLTHTLCVFDWDGNFIANFSCEKPIKYVDYNQNREKLLLLSLDSDDNWGIYSINESEIEKYINNYGEL